MPTGFFEKLIAFTRSTWSHGPVKVLEELPSGAKAAIAAYLLQHQKESILYVSGESAPKILGDLEFFGATALELPSISELETNADLKSFELKTLASLKQKPEQLVSCSVQTLLRTFIAPADLEPVALHLKKNGRYKFSTLLSELRNLGLIQMSSVTEKGSFAKRGGVIDLFPYNNDNPIRLEFDEDLLISLREFDPSTQISIGSIEHLKLMGCLNHHPRVSIFEYLSPKPLIIFDGLEEIEEQWIFFQRLQEMTLKLPQTPLLFFAEKPLSTLFTDQEDTRKFLGLNLYLEAHTHPFLPPSAFFITASSPNFEELQLELESFIHTGGQAILVYNTESEKTNLLKQNLHIKLTQGFLSQGYFCPEASELLLSIQDFSSYKTLRRAPIRTSHAYTSAEYAPPIPGDIVVHTHQGIGKYLGIEKRAGLHGEEVEYFKLEFAEKSLLYVPIKDAHLITRYVGASASLPTFSQLGSTKWQKIQAQTKAAIIGYAKELLEIAAKRQMSKGYSYSEDSPLQKLFETDFPYTATEDQIKAVTAIKQDMWAEMPMDRLICGDVGYGKTEVAMRAAFKAVVDGHKQVAILVPTTVLALQHYENFQERMRKFPIKLGILSRFSSPKEVKSTLKKIEDGTLDIVIGTHRILSPDVLFKDLGLMIVDEEQRFGVKAKEALKKLKNTLDCLTLSATPIPRTLYTSIVGMKQMSLISTPPYDRLPVTTLLSVYDETLIKQALLKELARKGQSYYIHNRVENLPLIHKKLQAMIPEAKIGIAHGQMDADAIDTVFHAFKTGALDILIATTLVENGVDIPNANTILIDNAHHFGLSDLYQLKGRVGRWNKAAICYLLVPKSLQLDEPTRKRLDAIVSSSGYGGGLKVAMRDLEIRGAGNLLGQEQSGHVSQVGFTLYCKLLKKTLHAIQKKLPLQPIEPKIECAHEAKIPESYIDDVETRIEFYQRFGEVETDAETTALYQELLDRFGKMPQAIQWLYIVTKLRLFCTGHYILKLSIQKLTTTFEKNIQGSLKLFTISLNSQKNPLLFEKELKEKIEALLKP